MPIRINGAAPDAIYIDGAPVDKVMLNGEQLWPESVAYATWDPARLGSAPGAVLSNGNLRLQRTSGAGNYGNAISSAPLAGKVYYEVEINLQGTTSANVGAGVTQQAAGAPGNAHGASTTGGTQVFPRQFDYLNYWDSSANPYVQNDNYDGTHPVHRFGIAVDVPNRLVWVRQVRAGGIALPWVGGAAEPYQIGDPATGAFPTRTLAGTNPLYASASIEPATATIWIDLYSDPATHYVAPPAGFIAGIPV